METLAAVSEVRLRPALPSDAAAAAPLILEAGPVFLPLCFGPGPQRALALLETLFRLPDNYFSAADAVVAERDGRLVGIALATEARRHEAHGPRMFGLVGRHRGLGTLLRVLPDAIAACACTPCVHRDALYMTIIAVAPECRSRGIGARLLADVERRAREQGLSRVTLHVESDHHDARRFYERHGYAVITERRSPRLVRQGVAGLVGMCREVNGPLPPPFRLAAPPAG
ncbi:MAG: GNAT family N-acetyltransferase [Armatimonadetes bacterium]|nr:GNAT family N-acetyltransferase [Armatimonadota bacterium]